MVRGGAIPVPSQDHPKDPYLVYLRLKAYPRPNEGLFGHLDEVSQIGSRIGSRMTRIDPE